jgi:hypothetical protein
VTPGNSLWKRAKRAVGGFDRRSENIRCCRSCRAIVDELAILSRANRLPSDKKSSSKQASLFQEQAAHDLRTHKGPLLSCCAGSEVFLGEVGAGRCFRTCPLSALWRHKTMKLNIDNAKKSRGRQPVELEAVNVRPTLPTLED